MIHLGLWIDLSKRPEALVHDAFRATVAMFQNPEPGLLKRFKGASIGAAGFSFGFEPERIRAPGRTALAQAVEQWVATVDADVLLTVDEAQSALQSEDGRALLHALKAQAPWAPAEEVSQPPMDLSIESLPAWRLPKL